MKDWDITFDERLYESNNARALLAVTLFHALRDYIDGDLDADEWFFSDASTEELDLDTEKHLTFLDVCNALDMDPQRFRRKLVGFTTEELQAIKKKLRRSRSDKCGESNEF